MKRANIAACCVVSMLLLSGECRAATIDSNASGATKSDVGQAAGQLARTEIKLDKKATSSGIELVTEADLFKGAMDAYTHKNYAKALKTLSLLADKGNADASFNVAYMYEKGEGADVDYQKARSWYEKAAAQHAVKAYVNLGRLYEYGFGVKKDKQRAVDWYVKAVTESLADHDQPVASFSLKTLKLADPENKHIKQFTKVFAHNQWPFP